MRLHRRIEGRLGGVSDRSASGMSAGQQRTLLITTVLICAAVFTVAFLIGLHHP